MVEVFDIRLDLAAEQPTDDRHEGLEETEVKGDAEHGARTGTNLDAGSQGHRKSVHRHTERDEEDRKEGHGFCESAFREVSAGIGAQAALSEAYLTTAKSLLHKICTHQAAVKPPAKPAANPAQKPFFKPK